MLSADATAFIDDVLSRDDVQASFNWQPNPGPQEMAYQSQADVIGFGGAAGGGKSQLLLGKAFTQFRKAIIFRSHFTDLSDLVTDGDKIQDGQCSFVWGTKRRWDTLDSRQVELGAVEHDKDRTKYRGRPHDFIGIDEAAEFRESTFRYLSAWLRTTDKEQHTQVVLTFNPPTSPDGEWIIKYFAAWIDPQHSDPAKPGELRWYAFINDKDEQAPGPEPIIRDGKEYTPQSRTFIPARLEDNPYYIGTDYETQLANLPEPLRSQLRYGDFTIGGKDDPWQVIPTAWVLDAQNRWEVTPKPDVALRAIGADIAHGGADNTVIAQLFGTWFDELDVYPGGITPNGDEAARRVEQRWDGNATIAVDSIGYGASAADTMVNWKMQPVQVNFGATSSAYDKSRRFKMFNVRAEAYWLLRDALDPVSGEEICLPPSRTLRADLCAPRYNIVRGKIQLEEKKAIKKRLNRSPDEGDTVVLAWYAVAARAPFGVMELSYGDEVRYDDF